MSKHAESDLVLLLFRLANTASRFVLAVCFCLLLQPVSLEASINAGRIYQLQQRLIDNPRDIEAHLNLAMEYSLANNFVKAVEAYFVLLRIDPNNFHAYNNLGILYKKSGQYRDSLHCYKQAERINPDSYWVPYNMGLCYEAMGRMQEARESYGRALSLNPSFAQALQRLRALSEGGDNVPLLPGLEESQIYLVDSATSQPKAYGGRQPAADVKTEPARPVKTATAPKTDLQKPPETAEKISERLAKEKEKSKEVKNYRTTRKGAGASIFNQAMDALDAGNVEKALELYVTCILAERDFLAEPENGLIKKGLEYLKERPNRMTNGQFYRGLLIYISGNLELAVPDLKSFLETSGSSKKNANSQFVEEASRIVARHEAEKAEREAKAKERADALAAAQMAAAAQTPVASGSEETERPRPSDFVLKRMSVEQIVEEADRLSRESRLSDAVAVLETGLASSPDDLQLLMKSANAYTDMLLLKGDQEAGKMALARFEKIYAKAPPNSREWAVAQEMIAELKKRVR
ncbi:MAG TPA: tetratricopeptide repeat protein [Candidatus Rifleibacterium sp.]|nr:tetratricopeptide repeat protein [Candidatus Rifleibacterium sp.]HPW58423.1 tetratricopeptide repeat protein [Candidatus Rifleibacterium sp.]